MSWDAIRVLCAGTGSGIGTQLSENDHPFSVRERSEACEIVQTVAGGDVDCVLLGTGVASLDTLDVFERIRDENRSVPVVLYGGSDTLIEAALDAGVTDVVPDGPDTRTAVVTNRLATVAERAPVSASATPEERLHSLLESSADRLSVLDEDGTYTFVSPAVEQLMGYDPGELLGTSGFEYVHPEDRDHVKSAFESLLSNPEETVTMQYRVCDADGNWRRVESIGTNRLDDPEIDGVVVNSQEITERKEHQRELNEEQAFTEAIFAALPDVFYAFDQQGNFLRWNDQLSSVTGYDDAEIESMHPADLIADEDRAVVFDAIGEVFEQETTVTVEARFETNGGERLPYEFTGAKVTDESGDTLGLVGIGRDISDRKERQRRFEAVFNNTYQFTGLMEPDGTLVEANETALDFAGVDRETVIGSKLWDAYWFRNSDVARDAAREAVEQARTGSLYREEVTVQGVEDTEIIDFSVRPITDDDGNVTLLIPEGRVITELKHREQHLGVLHRFLRHNLRNKMTVIEGTAGLLAAEIEESTYQEHVTQIRGAAADLIELSETAHELSQVVIEADGDQQPTDLGRTLTSVVTQLRDEYPSASVSMPATIEQWVSADWRLTKVFEQLLENAIEHADSTNPSVDIEITETAETVVVRIADDGPGIPEGELAGITTDEEQTQLTHGTGFGLWLVRSVLNDYGGDLSYEAPTEEGSVLVVTLQKSAESARVSEHSGEASES